MNRRQVLIGAGAAAVVGGGAGWIGISGMGSDSDYAAGIAPLRAPLPGAASARDCIRYATLAANGHNTQPWQFRIADKRIDILPDLSRRTPVVDPDDHHIFVSLGCAAENLSLASAACGRPGNIAFDPAGTGSAVFEFDRGRASRSALFAAIPVRQSTRAVFDGRAASVDDLDLLAQAGAVPGVDLVLLTDRVAINQVRDLVVAGNSEQLADPAFTRELTAWLRFNPRQALRTGDGLYSVASGNPALPDWLGPRAFTWFSTAQSQNEAYARQIRSSAGIAAFAGARDDPAHWLAVGQACQRFSLQATALGMKHAYINQPVEVPALRPELIGLPGRRPDIVMRFGYGPALPWSPRRPVAPVILA